MSSGNKAKVALVLTGHMRCWEQVYPNIKKNFIDPYDTTVFISTWNDEGYWTSPENDPKGVGVNTASPKLDFDRIQQVYGPNLDMMGLSHDENESARFIYSEKAKALEPFCNQIRPLNILCQFDRIVDGYDMMQTSAILGKSEFDWVIRMRPDLIINSPLPNFNTTPRDFVFSLHHPNHEGLGTGDMFLASDYWFAVEFMKRVELDMYDSTMLVNGRFCPHIYTKKTIMRLCEKSQHKHVELRVEKQLMHTPRGQYQDVPNG